MFCLRFIFFLNRAAVGWAVSSSPFGLLFFFLVLSVSRPKLPAHSANCCHRMMSPSANYRLFLSSFRHIPPSGAFFQVSKLTIQTEHGRLWEMFIWSKLGQTPLEMHIRTFARIKNLIWDLLQATKAEIIQTQAIFSCLCKTEGDFVI